MRSLVVVALAAFLFVAISSPACLFARQDNFEEFVERDSSGFIVIEDPGFIMERIESSIFFNNRHFIRAMELLTDPQYALSSEASLRTLQDQWDEAKEAFQKLQEVNVIIHSWDETAAIPNVSIVMVGAVDVVETLEANLKLGKSLLIQSTMASPLSNPSRGNDESDDEEAVEDDGEGVDEDQGVDEDVDESVDDDQGVDEDVDEGLEEGDDDEEYNVEDTFETEDIFTALRDSFHAMVVKQVGDCVVISNDEEKSAELIQRLENAPARKFRPLSKSRAFQQVQKLLGKRTGTIAVRGFIVPRNFPALSTDLISLDLVGIDPKSLPAAGFQVALELDDKTIETPDGIYNPMLSWDYVVTYTVPSSGFGKLIESFEPLEEFPPLPFTITKLKAFGFDPIKRNEAGTEIATREEPVINEDVELSETDRIELDVDYSFEDFERFGPLALEENFNPEAILNSSNGVIEVFHEGNVNERFIAMEIHRVKDFEVMRQLFKQRIEGQNQYLDDTLKFAEVENSHGELFAQSESAIRETLLALSKEDPLTKAPEAGPLGNEIMSKQYEYFLNEDWMVYADHVSMKKFLSAVYDEEPEQGTFDILLKACQRDSAQESFFKLNYQSDKLRKGYQENAYEGPHILNKYKDQQEAWEVFTSEPNEDGLRNPIESTEDAVVAVKQLLFNAFNDTFGTSLSLYSASERNLQIFGRTFSLVQETD